MVISVLYRKILSGSILLLTLFSHSVSAEETDKLSFGNPNSNISIYLFTDWFCAGCVRLEPKIAILFPDFEKKAKIYFIDKTVVPETKNYTPYNLAFMTNNKKDYLEIRKELQEVAVRHRKPTPEQISKAMDAIGVKYQPLNEKDLKSGIQFFETTIKKYDVDATPTAVVVNKTNDKFKKLEGGKITERGLDKAIEELTK